MAAFGGHAIRVILADCLSRGLCGLAIVLVVMAALGHGGGHRHLPRRAIVGGAINRDCSGGNCRLAISQIPVAVARKGYDAAGIDLPRRAIVGAAVIGDD